MIVKGKCERCQERVSVEAEANEDVYSVCQKIAREHERVAPNCTGDLSTIRLVEGKSDG